MACESPYWSRGTSIAHTGKRACTRLRREAPRQRRDRNAGYGIRPRVGRAYDGSEVPLSRCRGPDGINQLPDRIPGIQLRVLWIRPRTSGQAECAANSIARDSLLPVTGFLQPVVARSFLLRSRRVALALIDLRTATAYANQHEDRCATLKNRPDISSPAASLTI